MSASNALHLISEINTSIVNSSLLAFRAASWFSEGAAVSSCGLSEINTHLQGSSIIKRTLNLNSYVELL